MSRKVIVRTRKSISTNNSASYQKKGNEEEKVLKKGLFISEKKPGKLSPSAGRMGLRLRDRSRWCSPRFRFPRAETAPYLGTVHCREYCLRPRLGKDRDATGRTSTREPVGEGPLVGYLAVCHLGTRSERIETWTSLPRSYVYAVSPVRFSAVQEWS